MCFVFTVEISHWQSALPTLGSPFMSNGCGDISHHGSLKRGNPSASQNKTGKGERVEERKRMRRKDPMARKVFLEVDQARFTRGNCLTGKDRCQTRQGDVRERVEREMNVCTPTDRRTEISCPLSPLHCFRCMNCLDVFAIICACLFVPALIVCLFPLVPRPAVIINAIECIEFLLYCRLPIDNWPGTTAGNYPNRLKLLLLLYS